MCNAVFYFFVLNIRWNMNFCRTKPSKLSFPEVVVQIYIMTY